MAVPRPFSVQSTLVDERRAFCPTCGGDRTTQLRGGRRWLQLGPIPLLPLRPGAAHVQCLHCRSTLPLEVFEAPTSDELERRVVDVVRGATVSTVAAGRADDPVLRRRAVQHLQTVLPGYDDEQLERDLRTHPYDAPVAAWPELLALASWLSPDGKELLLSGLVRVALASHAIAPAQRDLIDSVGRGLGLSRAHIAGVVSEVASSVEPPTDDAHGWT